jgi:hypothetical protein
MAASLYGDSAQAGHESFTFIDSSTARMRFCELITFQYSQRNKWKYSLKNSLKCSLTKGINCNKISKYHGA